MSTRRNVLIIDDDPDFTRAIAGLLTSAGFTVTSAVNGREGLELAHKTRPDLILLDVMMDERTEGFFTLQQIRASADLEATPVIVVSSIYTDQPSFRVSPEAGWLPASLFLPKPVDPIRLLQESQRLIGSPS
jgi:CheY-like chemotaxis protein